VSRVHANFVINAAGRPARTFSSSMRRVRAEVRQAKGVELEPEVLLYGKEWRSQL
jgi:UDP-N-acetylenolpyruvoylglucosamine reductase